MNFRCLLFTMMLLITSATFSQSISIYKSKKSVDETTAALVQLIKDKGLIFFETVSQDEIAKEHGLSVGPTKVVLFDDAKLTTQLISCQQTTALDLPLKILVWEENEDVYIGFMSPADMEKRFMLNDCHDTIEALSRLMIRVVTDLMRAM